MDERKRQKERDGGMDIGLVGICVCKGCVCGVYECKERREEKWK